MVIAYHVVTILELIWSVIVIMCFLRFVFTVCYFIFASCYAAASGRIKMNILRRTATVTKGNVSSVRASVNQLGVRPMKQQVRVGGIRAVIVAGRRRLAPAPRRASHAVVDCPSTVRTSVQMMRLDSPPEIRDRLVNRTYVGQWRRRLNRLFGSVDADRVFIDRCAVIDRNRFTVYRAASFVKRRFAWNARWHWCFVKLDEFWVDVAIQTQMQIIYW